jgi:hypothetical protein
MDEEQIQALVKSWHARSTREGDPVSKFVFLWFCFNARLSYESGKDHDRQMINWLKTASPASSALRRSYDQAMASEVFRRDLQTLVDNSPIHGTRRNKPQVVEIRDVDDFPNLVEGVYQVRCNLFHGGKRADDLRDQKLVKVSASILRKWVGNLVVGSRQ